MAVVAVVSIMIPATMVLSEKPEIYPNTIQLTTKIILVGVVFGRFSIDGIATWDICKSPRCKISRTFIER